jgi:hypothetical protein
MTANGKPLNPKKILEQFKNRRVNVWMHADLERPFTGVLKDAKEGMVKVCNDRNVNIKIPLDLIKEIEFAQPHFTLTLPPPEPKPEMHVTYSDHITIIKEEKDDE